MRLLWQSVALGSRVRRARGQRVLRRPRIYRLAGKQSWTSLLRQGIGMDLDWRWSNRSAIRKFDGRRVKQSRQHTPANSTRGHRAEQNGEERNEGD